MRNPSSAALAAVALLAFAASAGAVAPVHPLVRQTAAEAGETEMLVVLTEQADLGPAAALPTKLERGRFVYDTLWQTAAATQKGVRALLELRGAEYRSFYIVNALWVRGGAALVDELAARPEVARIDANPAVMQDLPSPEVELATAAAVEWNVTRVRAPEVWAMGYRGEGIVVAGADTGYRWTHNAIKGKYRGWTGFVASHDYNWHDAVHSGGGACGANAPAPCDDNGHGTHTMGTIVGDDGGSNQVGVAPGARWIGCRNMNVGAGTPATYLECMEFFLAPYPVAGTPAQGNPALAPDITSNSWTCPPSEGCSWDALLAGVQAQQAAGIMTVAAAGNSGPSCGTVNDPPGIYVETYTVGATTAADAMAGFSSRGVADSTGAPKPEIVAPGAGVRSASGSSDTGYMSLSGTSMATPAVAGGIALLWSARCALANDLPNTRTVMAAGARDLPAIVEACGGNYTTGPNNTWGHGLMDVVATLAAAPLPAGPANAAAGENPPGTIEVTWDALAGAAEYQVWRAAGNCPATGATLLATTTSTSYPDLAIATGTPYAYEIRAVSATGCATGPSACVSATASGIACAPDSAPPLVTAPAPVTLLATSCGAGALGQGTTAAESPALATFLAGDGGSDNCDATPQRLAPQAAGADVAASTFFPQGPTTVTFRWSDDAGNTGSADSTVTVRPFWGDLDENAAIDASDLVILANYLVGNVAPGTAPFTAPAAAAELDAAAGVSATDLVMLASHLVGNIACLPAS